MLTSTDLGVDRLVTTIGSYQTDLDGFAAWLAGKASEWGDLCVPYLASPEGEGLHERRIQFNILCNTAEELARAARLLAAGAPIGAVRKNVDDNYARITRSFGSVELEAWTAREQVCERVEDGVETVEIPDPDAPTVTVERTRYRWECKPILEEVSA